PKRQRSSPVEYFLTSSTMSSKNFHSFPRLVFHILLGTIVVSATSSHRHRVPIIDLGGADELVGTIREDGTIVDVNPKLNIIHGTV
ncbi:unnamed protein product, partial [Onchocerca ochengi]